MATRRNAIYTIHPYQKDGIWMFDDATVGLKEEAFVSGADTVIDLLIKRLGIKNAKKGFTMHFSAQLFPGNQLTIARREADKGGTWYYAEGLNAELWLCAALFLYFEQAPAHLYIQVKEKRR